MVTAETGENMRLWQQYKTWVASKGGILHCLVIVYLAALSWFTASPAFHTLVVGIWAKFPSSLQEVVEAVIEILAIYGIGSGVTSTVKAVQVKFTKKADPHD